jgi:C4-dicarboxylate-specific signal transduction histidine kinase
MRGLADQARRQKLEAVGQLASGLAHEINNPLQSILNYAQLIRARAGAGVVRDYAEEILAEVQRLATIVRNLQGLVHHEDELPAEVSLHDLVERTLSLFRAALHKDSIVLEVDVAQDLPAAWGSVHGVQQVLINLLTAARDALNHRHAERNDSKRLAIRAALVDGPGGSRLRLTVEDTGIVIPSSAMERLFEPFGAVEGREQGSGLALVLTQNIAKAAGGELRAGSDQLSTTSFHLDLPLAADQ